jgi:glyoxylase-like metal-dependent hydrolase (beta-lactamase superfamily II)
MPCYICVTCGVQYGERAVPPERCIICEDERQYVGWGGQQWTTLDEMRSSTYRNELRELEPGLTGIGTRPGFAIGQRALLVRGEQGNLLWDCISYLDDETVRAVEALGGVQAIACSHPHFYGSMVEWSRAFGGAKVYVPEADRAWITRADPAVELWSGTVDVFPGVTLIQTGGHFAGSAVAHWAAGAEGRGALLTGDSIQVVMDRRYVTFMWSYPNMLPLPRPAVAGIVRAVAPYDYDRIYGGWWHTVVERDAKAAVERSAERYLRLIEG